MRVTAVLFALLLVAFPVAGAIAGRWWALALPLAGWPLFYVGLQRGWWGDGVGDGWEFLAAAMTAVGLLTTAVAIAAGRRLP